MEIEEFSEKIKAYFETGLENCKIKVNNNLLTAETKTEGQKYPVISLAGVYEKYTLVKDFNKVAQMLLEAYKQSIKNQKKELPKTNLEDIIFIAVNAGENQEMLKGILHEKTGDTALLYCHEKSSEYITSVLETEVKGHDIKQIKEKAKNNLRKNHPCRCIPLEEYIKKAEYSPKNGYMDIEGIYVLTSEDSSYLFSSTGIYYAENEIEKLSRQIQSGLYILPCTTAETFIIKKEDFTREEAEEIMQEFKKGNKEYNLSGQILEYQSGRIQNPEINKENTNNKRKGR